MPTGENGSGNYRSLHPTGLLRERQPHAGIWHSHDSQRAAMPLFARQASVQHRHRVIMEIAMNAQIRKFFKEEDGVTALEYGLLAAVIAGVIIFFAQDGIKSVFDLVVVKLKAAINGGAASTPA